MTETDRPLLHICHAPADHAWVHGRLIPELGLSPGQYLTRADDELGTLRSQALEAAVERCRYTLIIASTAARHDKATQLVARLAQQLHLEGAEQRLIIFALGAEAARDHAAWAGAEPAQPLSLGQRALVGLACPDEASVTPAIAQLREMLALPAPVDVRPECPYPGLAEFDAARGELLFGRDGDRDDLVSRIRAGQGRVLVVGASGSGKSSLVHAKLIPELVRDRCLVQVVPRGDRLAAAVRGVIDGLEVPGLGAALEAYTAAVDGASPEQIAEARAWLPAPLADDTRRRVVVVDPLEAVFAEDAASRDPVFDVLGALWSRPWCSVVMCVRADFYDQLLDLRCWGELETGQYTLKRPDEAGLRDAIVKPALTAGVHVDAALVERLVRAVDGDRSSAVLPLLQVALQRLWTRLRWHHLSVADYERIVQGDQRGLAAVLAVHADAVLQKLTARGDHNVARRVLLELVHLGEGRPPTRRRRTIAELRRSGDAPGQLQRVLDALVEGRLVTTGDGDGARPGAAPRSSRHIDLAHDWLITGWHELVDWIENHCGDLRIQRRLEARVASGGLLSAAELPEFIRWIKVSDDSGGLLDANDAMRALVRRSVWVRRRNSALVGAGAAVAAALALGLYVSHSELRQSVGHAMKSELQSTETARQLRKVPGGSSMRACLVEQSRERVEQLRALGELGDDQQRIAIIGELEEARVDLEHGRLEQASAMYHRVLEEAQARAVADPGSAGPARDLSVVYSNLGDVSQAAGKLGEARRWLGEALVIRERLAAQYAGVAEPQLDLATLYEKQGELEVADGKLEEARGWLDRALAVSRKVVATNPDNADWQGDLLAVYDQLGEVAVRAGQGDDARVWYDQAVALATRLATAFPGNAERQRSLAALLDKRGDVAVRADRADQARAAFDKAFEIRSTLAAAGTDDAEFQRELAASFARQGELAQSAGRFEDARNWFDRVLAERKRLADIDPSNAGLARELAVSLEQRGIVAYHAGVLDDARGWFDKALAVRQALADAQPNNAVWQRDVCNGHVLVLVLAHDRAEAMMHFGEARRIHDQLARDGALRGDAEFARLAGALDELGVKVAAIP